MFKVLTCVLFKLFSLCNVQIVLVCVMFKCKRNGIIKKVVLSEETHTVDRSIISRKEKDILGRCILGIRWPVCLHICRSAHVHFQTSLRSCAVASQTQDGRGSTRGSRQLRLRHMLWSGVHQASTRSSSTWCGLVQTPFQAAWSGGATSLHSRLTKLLTCENNLLCLHMVFTTRPSRPILWPAATICRSIPNCDTN